MTLLQMKAQLQAVGEELRSSSEELRTKLMEPAPKMEEVREKEKYKKDVEERFNLLKAEVEKEDAEARNRIIKQNPVAFAGNDEQRVKAATAEFIRAGFKGGGIGEETRNLLGAIPAPSASGGEKLLPVNMQNTLIHEPFAKNPLREVVSTSAIKGLELPKIAYTLDDDAYVTDADTAKEIKQTGDKVTFGRNKMKILARISDTVLHGSDLELTAYVQNALNSGLAAKEKKVMLAPSPAAGEEHMSLYSAANGIAQVTGTNLYEAVTNAVADLNDDYRENAKIVMKFFDYISIIKVLANNNASLFTAPPERILGKPVVFCDSAVNPVVGDFNFARLNYDGPMIYDNDKDVKSGEYLFVVTAWYDVQILLKSAFRIAIVDAGV